VGYAEVKAMHKSSVGQLWKYVAKRAGISKAAYLEYFGDNEQACAIEFAQVFSFIRPFKVDEIKPDFSVPQSFCYLDKDIFSRLKRRKKVLV
jgi:predicted transcriptional regulator